MNKQNKANSLPGSAGPKWARRSHPSGLSWPSSTSTARDKGLMGTLLRFPYEVRADSEYFDEIQDVKITKEMLDLAKHIVDQKSGHFEPEKFEDHNAGLNSIVAGDTLLVIGDRWPDRLATHRCLEGRAANGKQGRLRSSTARSGTPPRKHNATAKPSRGTLAAFACVQVLLVDSRIDRILS